MDKVLTTFPKAILLNKKGGEIEVPEGLNHYHLEQKENRTLQYIFHLRKPESRLFLTGTVKATGQAEPTLTTTVIHHAPRTFARTHLRTLSTDRAKPHYEGKIKIEAAAFDCESFLEHHSLLIGEASHSWTRPSLEILADQVRCTHSATVQTITEEELFYLRSRGLDKERAIKLLIEAFLRA